MERRRAVDWLLAALPDYGYTRIDQSRHTPITIFYADENLDFKWFRMDLLDYSCGMWRWCWYLPTVWMPGCHIVRLMDRLPNLCSTKQLLAYLAEIRCVLFRVRLI
jgi:hypothetical protein